ncbi:integrase [Betaproteobacteria bacterium]|nr:integrase [Betaproteobacteria bacterium]
MPLTDTAIKSAKPAEKRQTMFDGGGLYLEVSPAGGKLWRLKYRFDGKEKLLALGKYPEVTLKDARERRDEARKLLANGTDPGAVKKAQKAAKLERAANTFEAVAAKWFEKWKTEVTIKTATNQWDRLAKHIMPFLGDCPIADIDAPKILAALRPLEARGTGDTLDKAKMAISLIMRFAVQNGWAQGDPVPSLRGAFKAAPEKHMAAIIDPMKFGQLLRDIDRYPGSPSVTSALKLLPLAFCRPGELRAMLWADIDLDKAEWKYTASKTRTEHLVPLARQAVAILTELFPITGHDKTGFVFPGMRPGRMLSDAALNAALRTLGYDTQTEVTGHGFRATARTLLAEELGFDPLIIEHQLAHRVPDNLGTAYNRTRYLPQRKAMMQTWADYLDKLKAGAEVIPLRGQAA